MNAITCKTNSNCNTLSPWAGFRELENHLERVFHGNANPGAWMPPVDIYETADAYILEADLPGMKKEDIAVQVLQDRVSIKGARKRPQREGETGYRRYERAEGQFERNFRINGGVDAEKVEAKFENGVLTVTLPKPETAKPRQIDVKVN